jgi:hypothetical protein
MEGNASAESAEKTPKDAGVGERLWGAVAGERVPPKPPNFGAGRCWKDVHTGWKVGVIGKSIIGRYRILWNH